MAKEILAVPEEHLADMIKVIRAGLAAVFEGCPCRKVSQEVRESLLAWCDEEEAYVKRMSGG